MSFGMSGLQKDGDPLFLTRHKLDARFQTRIWFGKAMFPNTSSWLEQEGFSTSHTFFLSNWRNLPTRRFLYVRQFEIRFVSHCQASTAGTTTKYQAAVVGRVSALPLLSLCRLEMKFFRAEKCVREYQSVSSFATEPEHVPSDKWTWKWNQNRKQSCYSAKLPCAFNTEQETSWGVKSSSEKFSASQIRRVCSRKGIKGVRRRCEQRGREIEPRCENMDRESCLSPQGQRQEDENVCKHKATSSSQHSVVDVKPSWRKMGSPRQRYLAFLTQRGNEDVPRKVSVRGIRSPKDTFLLSNNVPLVSSVLCKKKMKSMPTYSAAQWTWCTPEMKFDLT